MKRSVQNGICLPGKVALAGEFVERPGPPSLTCYTNTVVIYQGVFFVCLFVCLFSVCDITVVT